MPELQLDIKDRAARLLGHVTVDTLPSTLEAAINSVQAAVAAQGAGALATDAVAQAIRDRLPAAGAATETTLASVDGKLPALTSGRVPVAIGATSSIIGFIQTPGRWTDESATVLAAAASFTGTGYDLTGATSGSTTASSASFIDEFRLSATASHAGTLYLEVSRDNSAWRRIKAVPLAQADPTCVFYGEIIHRPSQRYGRLAFVNGATLQTHFAASTMRVA